MNISNYLGMPYDISGVFGVNCWTLYSLIKKQEQGVDVVAFKPKNPSKEAIFDTFKSAFSLGGHGHVRVYSPQNYDLVIMTKETKKRKIYHCGVWFDGSIIHARGTGKTGQVWMQSPEELRSYNIEFWRNE